MTRLLFKQRFFSWFDSYDIYYEDGSVAYQVQGKMAWGHLLEIYDATGNYCGKIREELLSFLPRFALFKGEQYLGEIKKEFTFFKPLFTLNCNDWRVEGDWMSWDYQVMDSAGNNIMQASKQLFNWTDTYVIDVARPENALLSLMIVLAIDAAKCSQAN